MRQGIKIIFSKGLPSVLCRLTTGTFVDLPVSHLTFTATVEGIFALGTTEQVSRDNHMIATGVATFALMSHRLAFPNVLADILC